MGIEKVIFLYSYAAYKGLPSDEGVEFLQRFGVEVVGYPKHIDVEDPLI
jgi:dCMP deaminase